MFKSKMTIARVSTDVTLMRFDMQRVTVILRLAIRKWVDFSPLHQIELNSDVHGIRSFCVRLDFRLDQERRYTSDKALSY